MTTIKRILEEIHARFKDCADGTVADYIPELAKANPEWYGIALVTTDGQFYSVGDCDREFTIQSISKAFCYGMALDNHGLDRVLSKIGVEPSGEAFNEISLEDGTGRPFNPMINAGAIAATSLIPGRGVEGRFERFRKKMSAYAGRNLQVDEAVYRSESATGFRNRAIAYLLRNSDIIEDPVEETVEVYFKQCSLLVTCDDLALMGACLANGGSNPVTGERVLKPGHVQKVLGVMATCGMYDATGEWIFRVGLPAKSGVGGGILGILPGQMGVAVFSPPLDAKGNSVRGLKTFDALSSRFNLHLLNLPPLTEFSIRNVLDLTETESRRQRPCEDRDLLRKHGEQAAIIELQGNLSFSTAERALRICQITKLRARTIILDLTRVGYADPAADQLVQEAAADLGEQRRLLFLVDPKGLFSRNCRSDNVAFFNKTDIALEKAENRVIEAHSRPKTGASELVPFHAFEIFQGLSGKELGVIENLLEMQSYKPGETIVAEGADPDYLYLLAKGSVALHVNADGKRHFVRGFSPGVSFGELAIIDRTKRSADVVAEDWATCYLIPAEAFNDLESSHPALFGRILRNLFRINIDILRSNTRELAAMSALANRDGETEAAGATD